MNSEDQKGKGSSCKLYENKMHETVDTMVKSISEER